SKQVPHPIQTGMVINHPIAVRRDLRPVAVLGIGGKLSSASAVGAHTPYVPIAASIRMEHDLFAVGRPRRCVAPAECRSELALPASVGAHHPQVGEARCIRCVQNPSVGHPEKIEVTAITRSYLRRL